MSDAKWAIAIRLGICAGVMGITGMPAWGAVLLYVGLNISSSLDTFGTYMVAWTLAIQDRIEAEENMAMEGQAHLAVVPDEPA